MEKQRIQKYLSSIGYCSRRKAEELILKGDIKLNGKKAILGEKINPNKDKILINDKELKNSKEKNYYIMLHKPRGYVTTLSDEKNRKCVADLIQDIESRIYPVGRLDKDSEGLLLMTNDGEFANKIMHPSKEIFKTYRVTVREKVTEEKVDSLKFGIDIETGITLPARAKILSREEERTVLEISISEGKNRQIRKMCEALDLTIIRLKRTKVGNLKLGMLKSGSYRELSKEEIKLIFKN